MRILIIFLIMVFPLDVFALDIFSSTTTTSMELSRSGKEYDLKEFITVNKDKLALDITKGEGEYLESLADILRVKKENKPYFFKVLKSNFSTIYKSENSTPEDIFTALNKVLKNDKVLAQYSL